MRNNLSDELADRIREMIASGTLKAGDRINEVHLAAELEVSRTPLREALSRLDSEKLIVSIPRRGFFVHQPTPEEIEQLYIIRAILDPAALRMAGQPSDAQLDRLEKLNEQILKAKGDPGEIINLDDQWHFELLSHCKNEILLDMIAQFIKRTRSLEYAYMKEHANVETTVSEHRKMIAALREKDVEGAADVLHQNMQSAVPALIAWVRNQLAT
ncbi:MAG: GntR family transcriptional regulator [Rhodothermales bacterium]